MFIRLSFSFICCLLFFFSIETQAKQNLLLQCLAKEEEGLHKKGPPDSLFRLNQEFVNELASVNDITLKRNYVDEICRSRVHSPSVSLLKLLLIKEHEIYDLSLSEVESSMRPFKMGYINEFQKQVPRLFFSYLSGLQSEMATPHCLENHIKELRGFSEKIKYLEDELTTRQMLSQKTVIESIFKKLEKLPEIKRKCLEESKRVKKKKNSRL